MRKQIKGCFLILFSMLLFFGIVGTSSATWYGFDFDDLGTGITEVGIESYMMLTTGDDGNFPGDVAVNLGTTTTKGDGQYGTNLLGTDTYIKNTATIEITFADRNIDQIIFDWEGIAPYAGDSFEVYANDVLFYSYEYSTFVNYQVHDSVENVIIDDFGTLSSIQTLRFENYSSGGIVALDNLKIENSVPEPATLLLLGTGLLGLAGIGRKKFFKNKK